MFKKSLNIKYNQKLKTVGLALFLIFIIIFIFSAVYFDKKISPFMNQYTVMKGQQMMTDLFGKTVNQKMDEMNLTYDKLIDISYSKAGEIQSMNTDVVTINRLKNEVTVQLSELLANEYEYKVDIPIGSLFDSEFLSGSGKTISFNNTVTGDVKSDFRSEFESKGINQTVHRLYIDITGNLLIIAAGEQQPIEMTTSVLVGETVLLGKVPSWNID